MTELTQSLTAEQIARMCADMDGAEERCPEGYVPTCTMQIGSARALLAMARELVRIRSALETLSRRSWTLADKGESNFWAWQNEPDGGALEYVAYEKDAAAATLKLAAMLGWEDPLSPPAPVAELKGGEG